MGNFFKLFLKGILVTILFPLILLVWVLYGVYCLGLFLVMFVKAVIEYFQGKEPAGEMIEDIESRRAILEKEEADAHAQQALNIMYQNVMAQQQVNNPAPAPTPAPAPMPTYGAGIFGEPNKVNESSEPGEEETQSEEVNDDSNIG